MNKRTLNIIMGLLILIILCSGGYLIKTMLFENDVAVTTAKYQSAILTPAGLASLSDKHDESAPSTIDLPIYSISDTDENKRYIIAEELQKYNSRFGYISKNGYITLSYNDTNPNTVTPSDLDTKVQDMFKEKKEIFIADKAININGSAVEAFRSTDGISFISVDDFNKAFENDKVSVIIGSSNTDDSMQTPASESEDVNNARANSGSTTTGSAASKQASQTNPALPRDIPNNSSNNNSNSSNTVSGSKIIVLDPGHGKSSSRMTAEEKTASGYVKNGNAWGEWRHWKTGTSNVECNGSGCSGRCPAGAKCWYPLGNGDRSTEPEINLNNALAAKKHLEQKGYTVRMTRTTNDENPSFSKRLSYCYPNNDNTKAADAEICVVIHSNAGGGKGSAYISAGGTYDQKMKNDTSSTYAANCNALGKAINDRIVAQTSLSKCGGGSIGGEEALIAFCKSPVPVGYMEIGFYDNASDLSVLKSESDKIGLSIAEGIDDYIKSH